MGEERTVLHLSTARTWRGGERQALFLAEGLAERGFRNVVAAPPGSPLADRAEEAGLAVRALRCRGEWDLLAAWRLRGLLKKEGAALLHAHDAHGVAVGGLAAGWAGVTAVCTRRVDFDVKRPSKYARMARVICISEAIRKICRAGGVDDSILRVVPSGIDRERIRSAPADAEGVRAEFAPDKKKPLILLNVASLTDHKGQRFLLEAMPAVLAALPQAHLVIVGTGELEDDLRRRARILAVEEDVTFAGFRDDVPRLLAGCDLFVMASHLEGLCTSVMDAMAAGRAVVATTAGGLPEVVDDGRTGLLAAPRDPDDLAEKMLDLLRDRKKRERFGHAARMEADRRFGRDRMVEGTLAVYREALPETGSDG